MAAKKKKTPSKPKAKKKAKRPAVKPGGRWRMSDLPVELQVELRDRLAEAKRGEGMMDFDEAMEKAPLGG